MQQQQHQQQLQQQQQQQLQQQQQQQHQQQLQQHQQQLQQHQQQLQQQQHAQRTVIVSNGNATTEDSIVWGDLTEPEPEVRVLDRSKNRQNDCFGHFSDFDRRPGRSDSGQISAKFWFLNFHPKNALLRKFGVFKTGPNVVPKSPKSSIGRFHKKPKTAPKML